MHLPVQIILRGIPGSPALEAAIREKSGRLEHVFDGILGCRVAVELAGRHKSQGGEFSVRVGLKLPGDEIVVDREHDQDVYVALREAFDAARRQLEDFVSLRRSGRHSAVNG